MAVSTHFLLLVVLHIVSAVQKEMHFYHISTVHFSPFQTTSAELPETVRPDDENLDSEGTQELFIQLLEIIYNSTEHAERRNICEIERSSRGVVILPNSTPDHGHTRCTLYWTMMDDTVQCVVLDSDVPLDEEDSPILSQISREYLVQRCMEKIITDYYDVDRWRTAVATGSEDDFWFTVVRSLTLDDVTEWVASHLDRIILTGVAFWGIYKQNIFIMQSIFILMLKDEDRNATYCIFLHCIILCVTVYGLDLFVIQNIAVWAVYNQDQIILTAIAVLTIYNLNPNISNELDFLGIYNKKLLIVQAFLVGWMSFVWEFRYYLYSVALVAIYKEEPFFVESIAVCGVYNQDRIILTGIAVLVIYYQHKKLRCPFTYKSAFIFSECFDLSFGLRPIRYVFSCIKKNIKKSKAAKPPAGKATREDLNDLQMDEDQGGGDSDQNKRTFAASMDIPLTLAGAGEGPNRLTPAGRRLAASMDIPLTLAGVEGQSRLAAGPTPAGRRCAASMDIPLTLAGDDDVQNRLTPAGRRFAASMDIPLTLADDGDEGQNRLFAGLTPAGPKFIT